MRAIVRLMNDWTRIRLRISRDPTEAIDHPSVTKQLPCRPCSA